MGAIAAGLLYRHVLAPVPPTLPKAESKGRAQRTWGKEGGGGFTVAQVAPADFEADAGATPHHATTATRSSRGTATAAAVATLGSKRNKKAH